MNHTAFVARARVGHVGVVVLWKTKGPRVCGVFVMSDRLSKICSACPHRHFHTHCHPRQRLFLISVDSISLSRLQRTTCLALHTTPSTGQKAASLSAIVTIIPGDLGGVRPLSNSEYGKSMSVAKRKEAERRASPHPHGCWLISDPPRLAFFSLPPGHNPANSRRIMPA